MFLSKLVHFIVLPPASLLLTALAGLVLRRFKPRAGAIVFRAALVLLLAVSTRFVGDLLMAPLENSTPVYTPQAAAGAQAIVVLTASVLPRAADYGGSDAPDGLALARMRYAAHIQHDTNLPILTSGGRVNPGHAQPLGESMAAALRTDFRTEVKWVEDQSATTAENAAFSAAILQPAGIKRIVLVTHAMHMPRAARVFRAAGFDVVPAPTAYYARPVSDLFQFLPSAGGLTTSYYACYEWFGLAWYRLRH